jgi:hypothetical protein
MMRDDHDALPLPLRARPLPWEDIGSLLSRVTRRMSYEQPTWLLHPESGQHHIRAADLPVFALRADYTFLERLLLLDQDTLYALTLNRFAAALNRSSPLPVFEDIHREFLQRLQESAAEEKYSSSRIDRPLLAKWDYRTFFLPVSSIKVCPICLEETETYDRLYWRARFLITCPRHAVFLRERCPACHAAIPSLRTSPTGCPTCGKGDYRTAPLSLHPYMPEASCLLEGDLLTLKALGVDCEAASGPLATWQGEGLASLSPQQYFSLLYSFCKVVEIFSADYLLALLTPEYHTMLVRLQGSRQVVPLRDTRVQIAITNWLFDSWPDHLFALLDALHLRCLHLSFGPSFQDYLPGSSSEESAMKPTASWIRYMNVTNQPLTDKGTARWYTGFSSASMPSAISRTTPCADEFREHQNGRGRASDRGEAWFHLLSVWVAAALRWETALLRGGNWFLKRRSSRTIYGS